MEKSLAHLEGIPDGASRAQVCRRADAPQAGGRSTRRLSDVPEIDLFFVEEQIFLVSVDVHTHWTRAVTASSNQGGIVFQGLKELRTQPLGTPRAIPMDTGGEF